VTVAAFVRRYADGGPARTVGVLVGALAVLGILRSDASGATDAVSRAPAASALDNATLGRALSAYAADPVKNRRGLRQLEKRGSASLPPVVVLAIADSYLRARSFGRAERRFRDVLAMNVGEPWRGWAELGIAGVRMARNDNVGARIHYGNVATGGGPSAPLATVLGALLDAREGRFDEAAADFDRVGGDSKAPTLVREVARLAAGYARYWAARYDDAVVAFANATSSGRLGDDARYGAARARWHAGDHQGALADMRALAATRSVREAVTAITPRLLDLDREAVLGAGFARYRQGPLRGPEDDLAEILDGDGATLARVALRELEADGAEGRTGDPTHESREPGPAVAAAPGSATGAPPAQLPAAGLHHDASGTSGAMIGLLLVLAAVAGTTIVMTLWWRTAGRHSPEERLHGR
jgi:hypothetical protein